VGDGRIDIEIQREIGPREDLLHHDKSSDLRVNQSPLKLSNGLRDTMRALSLQANARVKERKIREGFMFS